MDTAIALRVLAREAGINLVLTESVKGSVSLQLRHSDPMRAMEAVVQARGLVLTQQDQVWWAGTPAEWIALEKGRQEVRTLRLTQQDLIQRAYRLHHAKATDWLDHLLGHAVVTDSGSRGSAAHLPAVRAGGSSARWLSPRGQALADARTNHLVVLDVPEVHERLAQWVGELDVPLRQVQIEARIIEASEGFARSLGTRFQSLNDRLSLDWAANGWSGWSPARAALTLIGPGQSGQILAEISALEERGQGKLVATPSLVTADQARAVIEQGTELPYQVGSTASNTHTIAFRKAE